MTVVQRLTLLLLVLTCYVVAGAAQRRIPAAQPKLPPQIRGIEPERVTAGQTFRITVELPRGYPTGIRLTVRRVSHQAAAKYESDVIIDNRRPGDISPEDGIIEHVVRTDEGWLPLTAIRKLDESSERYVVGLDSGFQEMNMVTVTGGADAGALASVIDGNLDTLREAVREWAKIVSSPELVDRQVVEIDGANARTTTEESKFLLWGAARQPGRPTGPLHYFVLDEPPGPRSHADLAAAQKGALAASTSELEKALAQMPKDSVRRQAAEVERLKEVLGNADKAATLTPPVATSN